MEQQQQILQIQFASIVQSCTIFSSGSRTLPRVLPARAICIKDRIWQKFRKLIFASSERDCSFGNCMTSKPQPILLQQSHNWIRIQFDCSHSRTFKGFKLPVGAFKSLSTSISTTSTAILALLSVEHERLSFHAVLLLPSQPTIKRLWAPSLCVGCWMWLWARLSRKGGWRGVAVKLCNLSSILKAKSTLDSLWRRFPNEILKAALVALIPHHRCKEFKVLGMLPSYPAVKFYILSAISGAFFGATSVRWSDFVIIMYSGECQKRPKSKQKPLRRRESNGISHNVSIVKKRGKIFRRISRGRWRWRWSEERDSYRAINVYSSVFLSRLSAFVRLGIPWRLRLP